MKAGCHFGQCTSAHDASLSLEEGLTYLLRCLLLAHGIPKVSNLLASWGIEAQKNWQLRGDLCDHLFAASQQSTNTHACRITNVVCNSTFLCKETLPCKLSCRQS